MAAQRTFQRLREAITTTRRALANTIAGHAKDELPAATPIGEPTTYDNEELATVRGALVGQHGYWETTIEAHDRDGWPYDPTILEPLRSILDTAGPSGGDKTQAFIASRSLSTDAAMSGADLASDPSTLDHIIITRDHPYVLRGLPPEMAPHAGTETSDLRGERNNTYRLATGKMLYATAFGTYAGLTATAQGLPPSALMTTLAASMTASAYTSHRYGMSRSAAATHALSVSRERDSANARLSNLVGEREEIEAKVGATMREMFRRSWLSTENPQALQGTERRLAQQGSALIGLPLSEEAVRQLRADESPNDTTWNRAATVVALAIEEQLDLQRRLEKVGVRVPARAEGLVMYADALPAISQFREDRKLPPLSVRVDTTDHHAVTLLRPGRNHVTGDRTFEAVDLKPVVGQIVAAAMAKPERGLA